MNTQHFKNATRNKMHHSLLLLVLVLLVQPGWAQWFGRGPFSRIGHTANYDPASNRMIVFGGDTSQSSGRFHLNDVWYLGGPFSTGGNENWIQGKPTGTPPSPRIDATAVYNPTLNRLIVFGGAGGFATPCFNDVWVLTDANGTGTIAPAWVQLFPTGGPPAARFVHSAVYDAGHDIMTIFGGSNCFTPTVNYNDVWVLTNASGANGTPNWTLLQMNGPFCFGPPTARHNTSTVYDPSTNRMIVYGGFDVNNNALGDVWYLSDANGTGGSGCWETITPNCPIFLHRPECPVPRAGHSANYDAVNNRMIVFGGDNPTDGFLNELWVLNNANAEGTIPSWVFVSPGFIAAPGLLPMKRTYHTAIYNSTLSRVAVFGGYIQPNDGCCGDNFADDVWIFASSSM